MTIDLTKLKPGDTVVFRNGGRSVVESRKNARDRGSIIYLIDHDFGETYWNHGQRNAPSISQFDIVAIEPAPGPIVRFVNFYPRVNYGSIHVSEEDANEAAGDDRLACIRLTFDPATKTASAEVVG